MANSIGPLVVVLMVHRDYGKVESEMGMGSDVYWILVMGGFGIIVGLFVMGYKIIEAIGI